MYFSDKNNTNIDDEFKKNNKSFLKFLYNYKLLVFIFIAVIILLIIMMLFFSKKDVPNIQIINYLELKGDENITLYQGLDYVEPGYNAYNSNGEDLTNDVDIKSMLDINRIGEYEIIYTIGDISKTRNVTVVERPKEYTYIYLKTINNDINVYLEIGEEFVEPGYQVFSNVGLDLTSQVKVTGIVDTSKKGTYRLIYSVVDSNNVTISAERTVIVMDTEVELLLSTTQYTNKDVYIKVKIMDEYFDYMILPDNTKVIESMYSYKVSKNGTYTFKIYNTKGMVKEKSINVKNIDKTLPMGTCTVDHDKNGSFITISVKDNAGIKEYIYNNKQYTTNKIVLNEYIDFASVGVYDNAGNYQQINCEVLKLKEELLVDTSHYSDLKGLNYYKIGKADLTTVGCNVTTGDGNVREYFKVHELIASDLTGILTNVCRYINSSSWINELQSAGAYVNKEGSYHAKGLAIDFNDEWTYTVNGNTYRPYGGMGVMTWNRYNKFVCEVCNGKEDCEYNVNYVIFKRYFEGNGWCWGGNWGKEHFDPMHFEIRENNKCVIARKQQISCE